MNPKIAYFEAKKRSGRYIEGEGVLVRPYNFKLNKFICNESEYCDNMFSYGISYLRNILIGRVHSSIVDDYKTKLGKHLIKYFNSLSVLNYSNLVGILSEVLHNRMLFEAMSNDAYARCYLRKKTPTIYTNNYLTKPMLVHNVLVTGGLEAKTEDVLKECYRMGVVVSKSLVSKVRNGLHKKYYDRSV